MLQKKNKNTGFTLLELMVVIIILGILASLAAPQLIGHMEKAEATAITQTVNLVDGEIKQLAITHRISNCATSAKLVNTGNTYLDVIFNGEDLFLAAKKTAYSRSPHSVYTKLYNETTAASAGTAGLYSVGKMPFTLKTCEADANIYSFANVRTSVLENLVESQFPSISASFDPAVAKTTGALRYTAADSNDEHSIDFYVSR